MNEFFDWYLDKNEKQEFEEWKKKNDKETRHNVLKN